jgi:hypothetical protein
MINKLLTFLVFLGINLLAAYVPAGMVVVGLPGSASAGWKFLFSPVLLVLLGVWATDPEEAWVILITFLGLVGVLSAVACRWKTARVVLPCMVFVYSFFQGLLAAQIIIGIDAIGHS